MFESFSVKEDWKPFSLSLPRGVLNKFSYWEAPPWGPNLYPFIYHFSRKSYSFRILEPMSCVWPVNTLFPTIVSGLLCNGWLISVPGILRSTSYESTHPTLKYWPLGNWLFEQRRLVRSAVKFSLHLPSQIAPLRPVVRSSISRVWFDSWFQAIAPRWGMNA